MTNYTLTQALVDVIAKNHGRDMSTDTQPWEEILYHAIEQAVEAVPYPFQYRGKSSELSLLDILVMAKYGHEHIEASIDLKLNQDKDTPAYWMISTHVSKTGTAEPYDNLMKLVIQALKPRINLTDAERSLDMDQKVVVLKVKIEQYLNNVPLLLTGVNDQVIRPEPLTHSFGWVVFAKGSFDTFVVNILNVAMPGRLVTDTGIVPNTLTVGVKLPKYASMCTSPDTLIEQAKQLILDTQYTKYSVDHVTITPN